MEFFKYSKIQYGVLELASSMKTKVIFSSGRIVCLQCYPPLMIPRTVKQFFCKVFCAFGDSRPDVKFVKSKKFGRFHVRSREGVFLCYETTLTSAIQANQTCTQRSYMHHKVRKIFI